MLREALYGQNNWTSFAELILSAALLVCFALLIER